ncbi:Amino acid permease 3 [Abeliophyllum distichum]|uniref:Amino acid permease 3 n=1 Tax=Abeliophyllum distichum TaxID=126358 RepID=A0ABD1RFP1_9LAMI
MDLKVDLKQESEMAAEDTTQATKNKKLEKLRKVLLELALAVTQMEKIWKSIQALGAIAFTYSYSLILIEIQDIIQSPPSEYKTIKKATLLSVVLTTIFYMFCECFGYAAFGDLSPGNLLTDFGFYNTY